MRPCYIDSVIQVDKLSLGYHRMAWALVEQPSGLHDRFDNNLTIKRLVRLLFILFFKSDLYSARRSNEVQGGHKLPTEPTTRTCIRLGLQPTRTA